MRSVAKRLFKCAKPLVKDKRLDGFRCSSVNLLMIKHSLKSKNKMDITLHITYRLLTLSNEVQTVYIELRSGLFETQRSRRETDGTLVC